MQPPAAIETDRPRARSAALLQPVAAAAIVALSACLVGFRGRSAIYRPDEDNLITTGGPAETDRLLRLILDRP